LSLPSLGVPSPRPVGHLVAGFLACPGLFQVMLKPAWPPSPLAFAENTAALERSATGGTCARPARAIRGVWRIRWGLHVAVLRYKLRVIWTVANSKDATANSLLGEYANDLKAKGLIDSKMTAEILKSSGRVLDAFNHVRNNQSLAHVRREVEWWKPNNSEIQIEDPHPRIIRIFWTATKPDMPTQVLLEQSDFSGRWTIAQPVRTQLMPPTICRFDLIFLWTVERWHHSFSDLMCCRLKLLPRELFPIADFAKLSSDLLPVSLKAANGTLPNTLLQSRPFL